MAMGANIIHSGMASCFNPSSLPSIASAWATTNSVDEIITIGSNLTSNSIMLELYQDGWVVFLPDNVAYPIFADVPMSISLKDIRQIKIIGASGTKYRWIAMTY